MTTLYLSPIGVLIQQFTNLGAPLANGLVHIYVGGSIVTPQNSWTDATGTTLNANPLVLNSAGRLANASGQFVSVWVPANTPHQLLLADSAGNQLARLDNLYGINDPTAILAALQASGGVDSIANAVRSYGIFTDLRASAEPVLASGNTLIVLLEGGASINDGLGGAFYWSASSSAADDSFNVIKLTASSGVGRFLRVSWNAAYGIDPLLNQYALGWLDVPQNIQNADYSPVLADRSKQLYHSSATPHTYTIPANASVAFPIGAVLHGVVANGSGNLTLAITTDTLRWAPVGSTGSRTIAANGNWSAEKITATEWQLTGVNIS